MGGTIISLPNAAPSGKRDTAQVRDHEERMARLYAQTDDAEENTSPVLPTVSVPVTQGRATSPVQNFAAQFSPTRIRLKEGRFSFSIEVLFFCQNGANGILIGIDPREANDIQFQINEEYYLEHDGLAYPRSLHMGAFAPFRDEPYQLLSFMRTPEQTND